MVEFGEQSGDDTETDERLWIDRYIFPALREPTLLPLLLVMIGHVVVFVAPAMLFAFRDGSLGARVALFGLAGLTYSCVRFEWKRHRRPDLLSLIALGTWAASAATAWACDHYRLF